MTNINSIGTTSEGIKLISLEFFNDEVFGNLRYDFINEDNELGKIYTTVLIGPNGTLKSRLFQRLIEIFLAIEEIIRGKDASFAYYFKFVYSFNSNLYEISFREIIKQKSPNVSLVGFRFKINGNEDEDISSLKLPERIIASTIMLTDRFPFPKTEEFPNYYYLGPRFRPQFASARTYISRVIELISKNIDSSEFIRNLKAVVKEFSPEDKDVYVTYYTKNTRKYFDGNLTVDFLTNHFNEIDNAYKKSKKTPPFYMNYYNSKIKDDRFLIFGIVELANDLVNNGISTGLNKRTSYAISFNLFDPKELLQLNINHGLLDHMKSLGMISTPELEFLDKDNMIPTGFSIYDSSSGEYNLFGTMVGLLSVAVPNSLIFIDEPEISLHPNWQMKYFSILKKVFSDFKYGTCHLLVATHSHFIISDLEGTNSNIIALTRDKDNGKLKAESLDIDPFGWSAENVLLNVFDVATTRNYYIAERLSQIFKEASNSENPDLSQYKEELLKWYDQLRPNDPLHYTIEKLIERGKWQD